MFRYAKLNIKCKRFYLKVKKNQIAETLISEILQYKQK